MNNKIVHDALVLAVFSLVLGFILGGVYSITKPAIDAANLRKEQAAFYEVFETADKFSAVAYDVDAAKEMMEAEGFTDTIDDVQAALDKDGNVLGHVVTITAKGSQGPITLTVGVQNDGTVNGYFILAHSESPGLGDKAAKEDFMSQFRGKKVDSFVVVKTTPGADNEIQSITGSTITSKAVANACNAAIVYALSLDGTEPLVGGAE